MIRAALLASLLLSCPAAAQVVTTPSGGNIDTSNLATKSEVQAAQTTANNAAANACPPANTVPPMEAVTASAGTAATCRRSDAPSPRITRSARFSITAAAGMLTVTWADPLPAGAASYPVYFTPIGGANTAPVKWKVVSATNTGFSAQCYQEASTLNFTLSALTAAGLTGLLLPVSMTCATGTETFALQLPSTQ